MEDPENIPGPGEQGFDPDLWEECEEEEEGFIIFFGKILIAMIAITLVTYFFWFLEQQKKKQKNKDKKEEETDELAASSDSKEAESHGLLEGRTVQHLRYEPKSVEAGTTSIDSDINRRVAATVSTDSKDIAANGVGVHGEAGLSAHLEKNERIGPFEDSAKDDQNQVDASTMQIQVTRPSNEQGTPTRILLKGSEVSSASALKNVESGERQEVQIPECTAADTHIIENGTPSKSNHAPTEVLHNNDVVPLKHSPKPAALSEMQTDFQQNQANSQVDHDDGVGTMQGTQRVKESSTNERAEAEQNQMEGTAPAENTEFATSENVSAPSKSEEIGLLKFDEATDLRSTNAITAEPEPNIQEIKLVTLEASPERIEESEPPNSVGKKEEIAGSNTELGKDKIEQKLHEQNEATPLPELHETAKYENTKAAAMDGYENEPPVVQQEEEEMGTNTNQSLSSSRKKEKAEELAEDGEPAVLSDSSKEDLLKNANQSVSELPTEMGSHIMDATVEQDGVKLDDINHPVQVAAVNQADDLFKMNQEGNGIMEKSTESSKTVTSESSYAQADSLKPEDKQDGAKNMTEIKGPIEKASEEIQIPSKTDKENVAEVILEKKKVQDAEAEPSLSPDPAAQLQQKLAAPEKELPSPKEEKPTDGLQQELPKQRTAARASSEATSGASLSTVDELSIDKSLQKVKVTADQREHLDETYDKIKTKIMADDVSAAQNQETKPIQGETSNVQATQEATMEMVKSKDAAGETIAATNAIIEAPLQVAADLPLPPSDQWEVEASVSVSLPSLSSEPDEMPSITTAPEIESYAVGERADSEIREELPRDEPIAASNAHVQQAAPAFVASRPKELGKPPSNRHTSPQIDVDIAVTTPSPPQSPVSSNKVSSMLEVLGTSSLTEALMKIQTLQQVSEVMRQAGLQSSNLIFGIDYTASNKYQGENSFGGRSLHSIEPGLNNPYQQVIRIMGKTLAPFATSGYIPAFGFGDVHTSDWSVFPLKKEAYCGSFDEVLDVYNRITPKVILSGPTNFAPLILQSIDICKLVGDYHILVIVADGQVTNERATRRAIVDACKYPLSIIVVGVGDGPWDMMRVFDESLPKRPWDNFHFVEFSKIAKEGADEYELEFAIDSLLEIPDQYKKIKKLGLLNRSLSPPGSQ